MGKTHLILPRTAVSVHKVLTTADVSVTHVGARATRYVLELPNYANTVTTTLSIIDANSVTIWTGAAHAQNANYSVPIDVELCGTYTLRLTLSGAAGGVGGTAQLTVLGD